MLAILIVYILITVMIHLIILATAICILLHEMYYASCLRINFGFHSSKSQRRAKQRRTEHFPHIRSKLSTSLADEDPPATGENIKTSPG
jgi:hypothetical protein